MPYRQDRACKIPTCPNRTGNSSGYCEAHLHLAAPSRKPDRRTSAARRGYGAEWRAVRAQVLARAGIPRADWPLYDVDHNPAYNPDIEPDHRKYALIPRLHAEHSSKTVREDGGFGRRGGGGIESSGTPGIDRTGASSFHSSKIPGGGI